MAAALAPKAQIVMFFTEFTEQGWVDALTTAVTATEKRPEWSIKFPRPGHLLGFHS
jgi:hypothetical protein